MKNLFYDRYFESIYGGLKDALYVLNSESVSLERFFNKIKIVLSVLKEQKNKISFFGNGASAAFANHMALDFSKNGKILSKFLSDSALLTALSNDYSFDDAFVEFLKIKGVTKNDLIITISSSGNSSNIIKVLEYCESN